MSTLERIAYAIVAFAAFMVATIFGVAVVEAVLFHGPVYYFVVGFPMVILFIWMSGQLTHRVFYGHRD